MQRKICCKCKKNPVAINYRKNEKTYYRKHCDSCGRKTKKGIPLWYKSGYRLKNKCDRCGFASKYDIQFNVYHIDGDLRNSRLTNLKTICKNCQQLLHVLQLPWKQGDLTPDNPQ